MRGNFSLISQKPQQTPSEVDPYLRMSIQQSLRLTLLDANDVHEKDAARYNTRLYTARSRMLFVGEEIVILACLVLGA